MAIVFQNIKNFHKNFTIKHLRFDSAILTIQNGHFVKRIAANVGNAFCEPATSAFSLSGLRNTRAGVAASGQFQGECGGVAHIVIYFQRKIPN